MIGQKKIANIALKAILAEVSAAPKPGLVDIIDSGSHTDMDYITFANSGLALKDYFEDAFLLGQKNYNKNDFEELRQLGIKAEEKMYQATNNVNTHKGTIFSLGLFVYATGIQYELANLSAESIIDKIKELCYGISKELSYDIDTAGGKQYKKYGLKGIRGEAEQGFEKSMTIGLRNLKRYTRSLSLNDSLINLMMDFMSELNDSNLIKRGGLEGLNYAKESAITAKSLGNMETPEGRRYIKDLNIKFVHKNLSPGGTADYLILSLYLYFLEKKIDRMNI